MNKKGLEGLGRLIDKRESRTANKIFAGAADIGPEAGTTLKKSKINRILMPSRLHCANLRRMPSISSIGINSFPFITFTRINRKT